MSCGIGCRHDSDLGWLWLWHRPAATASIRRLAWEPPFATGVALKRQGKKKIPSNTYSESGGLKLQPPEISLASQDFKNEVLLVYTFIPLC